MKEQQKNNKHLYMDFSMEMVVADITNVKVEINIHGH